MFKMSIVAAEKFKKSFVGLHNSNVKNHWFKCYFTKILLKLLVYEMKVKNCFILFIKLEI